jgi:hypothetical protein
MEGRGEGVFIKMKNKKGRSSGGGSCIDLSELGAFRMWLSVGVQDWEFIF